MTLGKTVTARGGARQLVVAGLGLLAATGLAFAETPAERGAYLVNGIAGCGNCHTMQTPNGPDKTMELAGGMPFEEKGVHAVAANITPDKETGIGAWTDAQIITAIREGKKPDGGTLGPPMPFEVYRAMADEDVQAIVAYLRTVKPISNKTAESKYDFPLPPAWGPPVGSVAAPDRADKVAYGAYLAGPLGHCIVCHSSPNAQGAPDIEHKLGQGGMEFKGPWGVSVSPALTPSNLSKYSDADIKKIVTTGVRPDGSHLKPPMGIGYYATIKDEDLDAIIAYLRTLPNG